MISPEPYIYAHLAEQPSLGTLSCSDGLEVDLRAQITKDPRDREAYLLMYGDYPQVGEQPVTRYSFLLRFPSPQALLDKKNTFPEGQDHNALGALMDARSAYTGTFNDAGGMDAVRECIEHGAEALKEDFDIELDQAALLSMIEAHRRSLGCNVISVASKPTSLLEKP